MLHQTQATQYNAPIAQHAPVSVIVVCNTGLMVQRLYLVQTSQRVVSTSSYSALV